MPSQLLTIKSSDLKNCSWIGRYLWIYLPPVIFSANGDEILGGANNGYIYIYDRFAQTRSLRIDAHDDDVNAVAFVDEATHILASGGNK